MNEQVNWKKRHEELAVLASELANKLHELDILQHRIHNFTAESDRLSLRERGVRRYLRLTRDVKITPRYDETPHASRLQPRKFFAGTLVEATKTYDVATVYLDDDGDGFLDFPNDALEEVELPWEEIDWSKVVSQG